MFRFSVLLAFIFAYMFGPSKATPLKKKNLRRRVRAPAPTMTNGLAALDANHLVSRHAVGYHDYSTDSSSGDDGHYHGHGHRHHRRRRKKGTRRLKYSRIKDCWCKCHHCGDGFISDTSYDLSPASTFTSTEASESDAPRPSPMNGRPPPPPPPPNGTQPPTRPASTPAPRPLKGPSSVLSTTDEDTDSGFTSGFTAPPPPVSDGTLPSSDSDYGYHSGCH